MRGKRSGKSAFALVLLAVLSAPCFPTAASALSILGSTYIKWWGPQYQTGSGVWPLPNREFGSKIVIPNRATFVQFEVILEDLGPTDMLGGMPSTASLVFEGYPDGSVGTGVVSFGKYSIWAPNDTVSIGEVGDIGFWAGYYLGAFIEGNTIPWDPEGFKYQRLPATTARYSLEQWGAVEPFDALISFRINALGIAAPEPPATPVPEPTTMLLLGSGLVGLAGYGRKKRK